MKWIALFAAALVLPLAACNPFESKLLAKCEAVLSDRLRAPSTYHRVDVQRSLVDLSPEDWALVNSAPVGDRMHQFFIDDATQQLADGHKVQTIVLRISYDAENAYGAPIRNATECAYATVDENESNVASYNVKLDGMTTTEWLIDAVKRSK